MSESAVGVVYTEPIPSSKQKKRYEKAPSAQMPTAAALGGVHASEANPYTVTKMSKSLQKKMMANNTNSNGSNARRVSSNSG